MATAFPGTGSGLHARAVHLTRRTTGSSQEPALQLPGCVRQGVDVCGWIVCACIRECVLPPACLPPPLLLFYLIPHLLFLPSSSFFFLFPFLLLSLLHIYAAVCDWVVVSLTSPTHTTLSRTSTHTLMHHTNTPHTHRRACQVMSMARLCCMQL